MPTNKELRDLAQRDMADEQDSAWAAYDLTVAEARKRLRDNLDSIESRYNRIFKVIGD